MLEILSTQASLGKCPVTMKERISTWSMSVCVGEEPHNSQSQIHWHRRWTVSHLSTTVAHPPERHWTIKQRHMSQGNRRLKIELELTASMGWCSYFSSGSSRYCPHWMHLWKWVCGGTTQRRSEPAPSNPVSAAPPLLSPDARLPWNTLLFWFEPFFSQFWEQNTR